MRGGIDSRPIRYDNGFKDETESPLGDLLAYANLEAVVEGEWCLEEGLVGEEEGEEVGEAGSEVVEDCVEEGHGEELVRLRSVGTGDLRSHCAEQIER